MREIIIVILTLLYVSCQNVKDKTDFPRIDITRGIQKDENIFLSSISDKISYIPLETTSESLISSIKEIVFSDNYILVLDNLDKMLLFNHEGRFMRQIGKKGHGPFEYIYTSNAVFSENGEEVYLFDGASLKMIKYKTSTGEGVNEVRINRFIPRSFKLLNDTTLAFYCSAASFLSFGSFYHIFLLNTNFNIIDSLYYRYDLLSNNELGLRGWGITGIYKQNNKLYFWDSDTDTIYCLDKYRKVDASFVFSYDKFYMPLSIRHTQDFFRNSENYFFYDNVIETDNYFFIDGVYQGRYMKNILYDKIDNISCNVVFNYNIYDKGFHNDLDGGIPFWPKGKISDNIVYDVISPYELKRIINNDYFKTIPIKDKKKHTELISLISQSSLTDNPIIIIVRLFANE